MSENSINLLLGIVGTITGLFALFISLWSYLREKPNLKLEIIKSKHNFTHNLIEKQRLNLWADCQVKNLGDRGTRIRDAVCTFNHEGKSYRFRKYILGKEGTALFADTWVEAHDWRVFSVNFLNEFEEAQLESIDFIITLYHTHGSCKAMGKSLKFTIKT
jgi:hypothetical protein